jgi:hypothetical protein
MKIFRIAAKVKKMKEIEMETVISAQGAVHKVVTDGLGKQCDAILKKVQAQEGGEIKHDERYNQQPLLKPAPAMLATQEDVFANL